MKRVVLSIFEYYNNVVAFLRRKGKTTIPNGGLIAISAALIGIISFALLSDRYPGLSNTIGRICIATMIAIILFFLVFTSSPFIRLFTHGKNTTPESLFKELTHGSYLYGLVVFSSLVVYLLLSFFLILGNPIGTIVVKNAGVILVVVAFVFTFLYFCFHIYMAKTVLQIKNTELRMRQYAAIISSITLVIGYFGDETYFKFFFSGLAIVFTWLLYICAKEHTAMSCGLQTQAAPKE